MPFEDLSSLIGFGVEKVPQCSEILPRLLDTGVLPVELRDAQLSTLEQILEALQNIQKKGNLSTYSYGPPFYDTDQVGRKVIESLIEHIDKLIALKR